MAKPRYSPFEEITKMQKGLAKHAENSARLAHSMGSFTTTGWGEFRPEDAILFDCSYLYRPSVFPGSSFEEDENSEDIRPTRYPRCGGTVTKWERTNAGLYVGAHVVIWVEDRSPFMATSDPDPDVSYTIIHDFTFLGIATKDILSPLKGSNLGAF